MIERVLRNTAATISVTFYNGTTAVDADAGVTVTATRTDGTIVFATAALDEPGAGAYSVVIPPQVNLNILTLTWSGSFTGTVISIQSTVEIVGGFYFSLSELRAYDNSLANTTRFPNSALIQERLNVESEFEDITGRAFVPRFWSEVISGDGSETLWLSKAEPHAITKFIVDGVDCIAWVTADLIRADRESNSGLILKGAALAASYAQDIVIEYEYGMKRIPVQISEKAKKRARGNLIGLGSTIDPRATTMMLPDIGSVNLSTPGLRGAETGIPDIDVVLRRYTLTGSGVY